MDPSAFQIGFVVVCVIGILAALAAAQPRPTFRENQIRTWQAQDELAARCQTDPSWPAKQKLAKDMARFRYENAHAMAREREERTSQLRAA